MSEKNRQVFRQANPSSDMRVEVRLFSLHLIDDIATACKSVFIHTLDHQSAKHHYYYWKGGIMIVTLSDSSCHSKTTKIQEDGGR